MKKKRNGASPAKPPRPFSKGFHLFVGVLMGLLIAFLAFLHQQRQGGEEYNFNSIKATLDNSREKAPVAEQPHKPQIYFPVPEKPRYDFYQDLKQQEVYVPPYEGPGRVESEPLLLPLDEPISTPSTGTTSYTLQAGSFRLPEDAERRKAQLALLGLQARIERVNVTDGRWHRVRLGPYRSLQAANRVRTLLHSESINTMLVKSNPSNR